MNRQFVLAVAAALVALPALGQAQEARERPRSNPDLITIEEIREKAKDARTAHEAVERLRSRWLRPRPAQEFRQTQEQAGLPANRQRPSMTAASVIQVYVDGVRQGGIEVLRTLPVEALSEIRFLSGLNATSRFGPNHETGAILVQTARPPS